MNFKKGDKVVFTCKNCNNDWKHLLGKTAKVVGVYGSSTWMRVEYPFKTKMGGNIICLPQKDFKKVKEGNHPLTSIFK